MAEIQKRGFYIPREAWYGPALPSRRPEIALGIYCFDEAGNSKGCIAEWLIRWHDLVPCLVVFDDGWEVLFSPEMADLQGMLVGLTDSNATVAEMADCLKRIGFEDLTERETPERYRR